MTFPNNYVYITSKLFINENIIYSNTKKTIYFCLQQFDYYDELNLFLIEHLIDSTIKLWVTELDLCLVPDNQQYILEVIYGKKANQPI